MNLGPTTGVRSDTSRTLPTTLSGTTVTFDGVAAPILLLSIESWAVQAPTSLTTGALVRIQVANSSGSSPAVR